MQQLQKLLARALVRSPNPRVSRDVAEVEAEPPVANVTPLAASFAAALAAQPDSTPLDTLLQAHDELPVGSQESSSSGNVRRPIWIRWPLGAPCPLPLLP